MAIQFRANTDFNKNEILNPVVHKLAAAPSSPVTGQIYYNTGDNNLYVWDGTWTDLTTQGTTSPDATTGQKGLVQLAGDLGGTATSPTVPALANKANLASPTFTGTPLAPTAAVDTSTTQLATTAFVTGQAASANPVMDGAAAAGSSTRYARADHVHPSDTSRAPLASPTLTGTPAAPTAAVDTNTTQIATTAYVVGQGYLKSSSASSTYAPLASPALTGTPTAPTATGGTNTTQIATTAFVAAHAPSDPAAGTAGLRTLGTGATQAAAGNHTHASLHTQNTDTGTSSTSFFLVGTAAADVRLKKNASGELGVRLGDDSGYAAVQTGALTVNGNLSVTGTTTTINSNTLSVGDNIIELNNDVTTTAASTEDAGLTVRRYTGADVRQDAQFIWQESTDRWAHIFPASSGSTTVTRISAMKHQETLGAITGGTPVTVTHGLNTRDVAVSIRDTATNEFVYADVIANGVDTVQVTFAANASASAYSVTVVG